jgi:hypothetical protein
MRTHVIADFELVPGLEPRAQVGDPLEVLLDQDLHRHFKVGGNL